MKNILTITLLLFVSGLAFSQGINNDFDYDKEDLNFIFNKLGFNTFKLPIKQEQNKYLDFVIEEYRNGKLVQKISLIDSIKVSLSKWYGDETMNFFKPELDSLKKDSIYFHRFYFHNKDSILDLSIKTHKITKLLKFNIDDLGLVSVRAIYAINEEIKKNGFIQVDTGKVILFLYANNKNKQILLCPSGLDKKTLIDRYDYCLFIIVKPYKQTSE